MPIGAPVLLYHTFQGVVFFYFFLVGLGGAKGGYTTPSLVFNVQCSFFFFFLFIFPILI